MHRIGPGRRRVHYASGTAPGARVGSVRRRKRPKQHAVLSGRTGRYPATCLDCALVRVRREPSLRLEVALPVRTTARGSCRASRCRTPSDLTCLHASSGARGLQSTPVRNDVPVDRVPTAPSRVWWKHPLRVEPPTGRHASTLGRRDLPPLGRKARSHLALSGSGPAYPAHRLTGQRQNRDVRSAGRPRVGGGVV